MNIALFQDSSYIKQVNGATKADRELITATSKYCKCKVYVPFSSLLSFKDDRILQFLYIFWKSIINTRIEFGAGFELNFENIHIKLFSRFFISKTDYFKKYANKHKVDHILISPHHIKRELLELIYESIVDTDIPFSILVHTSFMLPFGTQSCYPSEYHHKIFSKAKNILVVSHYLQDYIRRYGDLESTVVRFPIMEQKNIEAIPYLVDIENLEEKFITLVNPCTLKGIDIFLQLAEIFPNYNFASVPSWGTTHNDLARIRKTKNITLLEWFNDVNDLFKKTKVLLFPSICHESFGLIIVEAMARGIPVIASNLGGIPEAKLGIDYMLPISPLEDYTNIANEVHCPPQDINLWRNALEEIIENKVLYEYLSKMSRLAAINYLNQSSLTSYSTIRDLFK